MRYAWPLVNTPIDGPFPEYIEFFNDEDILLRQQVMYEWLQAKCTHCAMLGHTEDVCKKKGVVRTEWRKVQKARVSAPGPSAPTQNLAQQPASPSALKFSNHLSCLLAKSKKYLVLGQIRRNNQGNLPQSPKVFLQGGLHQPKAYLQIILTISLF